MTIGALVLTAFAALRAQEPQATAPQVPKPGMHIQAPPATYKAPLGQTYVYDVEWRLWTAGSAVVKVDMVGSEAHVHAAGDSTGAVALLYHVHDTFDAFFNPETFCSSRIQKHVEEGSRRVESTTVFDAARNKAVFDQKNLRKGDSKHAEHPIPDCVTDVVSAIYYVSSLPLAPGASFEFPLNDGGETVQVTAHAEEREEVKTAAGTFKTIRVQPVASTGVLKDRGKIWVWYSDDAQRIPIQMRARMGWGTLTFKLTRVEK